MAKASVTSSPSAPSERSAGPTWPPPPPVRRATCTATTASHRSRRSTSRSALTTAKARAPSARWSPSTQRRSVRRGFCAAFLNVQQKMCQQQRHEPEEEIGPHSRGRLIASKYWRPFKWRQLPVSRLRARAVAAPTTLVFVYPSRQKKTTLCCSESQNGRHALLEGGLRRSPCCCLFSEPSGMPAGVWARSVSASEIEVNWQALSYSPERVLGYEVHFHVSNVNRNRTHTRRNASACHRRCRTQPADYSQTTRFFVRGLTGNRTRAVRFGVLGLKSKLIVVNRNVCSFN